MTITIEITSPRSAPLRVPFKDDTSMTNIVDHIRYHHQNMVYGCQFRVVSNDDPEVIPLAEYERRVEAAKKEVKRNKKKARRQQQRGPANMKLRR